MKLYSQKSYEAALAEFNKAAELDPTRPESWQGAGNCLYFLGRKEEALAAFEKAHALNPADDKLRAFVEKLRASLRGPRPASQVVEADLGLDLVESPGAKPSTPARAEKPEMEALLSEGERRLSAGDPWGAMDLGEKAIGLDPGHPGAKRLLARAYREAGFDRLARSVERESGAAGPSPLEGEGKGEGKASGLSEGEIGGGGEKPKQKRGGNSQTRNRKRYKRSSGGRLLAAFPLGDSLSRTLKTYSALPGASVDSPSIMGDFELNSRYNLGKLEFEAALLCFSFRRGLDVYSSATNYQQKIGTRATVFQGGLRYAIPAGSWSLVLGGAAGYIRGSAEFSDSFSSGTFSDDGLALELSFGAEKYVGAQISLGPFLRYRVARLDDWRAEDSAGFPLYLAEYDAGYGPDLWVLDGTLLRSLPGAKKAVIDMGGFSLGLELQYHY